MRTTPEQRARLRLLLDALGANSAWREFVNARDEVLVNLVVDYDSPEEGVATIARFTELDPGQSTAAALFVVLAKRLMPDLLDDIDELLGGEAGIGAH